MMLVLLALPWSTIASDPMIYWGHSPLIGGLTNGTNSPKFAVFLQDSLQLIAGMMPPKDETHLGVIDCWP